MSFFKNKRKSKDEKFNSEVIKTVDLILEVKDLQEEVIRLQRDKIALLENNKTLRKEKRELKRKEEKNGRSKSSKRGTSTKKA